MSEGRRLRINKALANAGVCSRRAADELIRAGEVTVNGVPMTEPGLQICLDSDIVHVRSKQVIPSEETVRRRELLYVLLHKPIQVVSTASDPQGRTTVLDLLPEELQAERLYPVGRLDYFSEGLLLLTNDGELTNRLTHPRYHLPKMYEVRIRETPTTAMLETMRRGMALREGERLAPVDAAYRPGTPGALFLTLRQGVNRQIRRMCRDMGLTILSLRRMRLGPLELGNLAKGKCRPLSAQEVAALKKAVGLP